MNRKIIHPVTLAVFLIFGSIISGKINIHSVQWFSSSMLQFGLAVFVYLKGKHNPLNRRFSLFNLSIALWGFSVYGLYIAPDVVFADYWTRMFNIGSIFIMPTGLHLILYLTRSDQERFKKLLLKIVYLLSFLLLIVNYMGLFVDGWSRIGWKYSPRPNLFYECYLIDLIVISFYSIYLVFNAYIINNHPYERRQYKYVFIACGVLVALGLPNMLLSFNYRFYPLGGIGSLLFTSIIAYAIVRHQIMDIQVIIRKSIVYASLTLAISGIYALVVGVITAVLDTGIFLAHEWVFNGLAGAIIAAVFLPLRTRIQYLVDRIFFKEKYNYRQMLKAFSEQLTSILEVDMLSEMLITRIMETMHIDRGCMLLLNNEKDVFEVSFLKGMGPDRPIGAPCGRDAALVRWLEKHRRIFILDENSAVAPISIGEGVIISIPLISRGKLIGMMNLGRKLSEDMYTSDDLELLTTLSNHAAIALENATLSVQMRMLEKNLYQTDKLTALGTFASSIAHEIKNPLVSIKTFCQLVSRKFGDVKFVEKFNSIVPAEIERLEGVLGQMLDFGKLSGASLSPVRVERVIDGLISLIRHETFRQNVRIIRSYGEDVPSIMASEEQLKQVFMNLVLNAIQAMPGGGEIRLSTARVTAGNAAACVEIRVADNGCGIPKESIDKLFKPFFTTKPNGTGLGLSITRKIIREHGGSIEVESAPGKGTIFTVRIPA